MPCATSVPQSILDRVAEDAGGRPPALDADGLRGRTPDHRTLLDRDAEWEARWSQYETTVTLPLIGLIADGNRCTAAARARD